MTSAFELLDPQRPEYPHLRSERFAHALVAAGDPPLELGEAAVLEQAVELAQTRRLEHWDETAAAEATHLALDATLFAGALLAPTRERRFEQVMGAQRDEAVLLDATAAAHHLLDRRTEIVVADQRERAAEEPE